MSEDINSKLWFSTLDEDFFLVPESVTLKEGDLEMCSYFGHKRHVDPSQAEIYKVPRQTAMSYIRIQVESFFSGLPERISKGLHELDWSNAAEKFADIIAPIFSIRDDDSDDETLPLEFVLDDEEENKTLH